MAQSQMLTALAFEERTTMMPLSAPPLGASVDGVESVTRLSFPPRAYGSSTHSGRAEEASE